MHQELSAVWASEHLAIRIGAVPVLHLPHGSDLLCLIENNDEPRTEPL